MPFVKSKFFVYKNKNLGVGVIKYSKRAADNFSEIEWLSISAFKDFYVLNLFADRYLVDSQCFGENIRANILNSYFVYIDFSEKALNEKIKKFDLEVSKMVESYKNNQKNQSENLNNLDDFGLYCSFLNQDIFLKADSSSEKSEAVSYLNIKKREWESFLVSLISV